MQLERKILDSFKNICYEPPHFAVESSTAVQACVNRCTINAMTGNPGAGTRPRQQC